MHAQWCPSSSPVPTEHYACRALAGVPAPLPGCPSSRCCKEGAKVLVREGICWSMARLCQRANVLRFPTVKWPPCALRRPCSAPSTTAPTPGQQQQEPQQQQAVEAVASVAARGATFLAAAGDLALPWLGQLGDFFAVAYSADPPEVAPPPAPLELAVHLQVSVHILATSSCPNQYTHLLLSPFWS